ncbi:MAG: undecaprenyl-diphosphatase [Polyangiales bacterium]
MTPADLDATSAMALGAVQGLTEFLPVSSSGHVAIGALLFGLEEAGPSLSIVLHLGTLVATLLLFRKDVAGLFVATGRAVAKPSSLRDSEDGRTLARIFIASIPTAVIGLLVKDHVEEWSRFPWIVGACLLVSAVLVITTRRSGVDGDAKKEISLSAALIVGVVQGIAVLPGISRSGATIAAAMMLGMAGASAFRFSFLLSLPAVAGAALLLLLKDNAFASVPPVLWLGGFVALVVGLFSLVLLRRVVNEGRFWAFSLYLVPVGIGLIVYDLWAGAS